MTRSTIFLRCEVCGNALIVARQPCDPPRAIVCVTNECDVCNAASGGYGACWYYDAAGNEVSGIDALIEASSLGTPEAKAIRAQADPALVDRVLARADELAAQRRARPGSSGRQGVE